MSDEFYLDERPGNSGGGGGGGGSTGGWGGGWGGDDPGPEPEQKPEWEVELCNQPYLKRNPDGWLLTDGAMPELLTGSLICTWPPPLIVWIDGDSGHEHTRCLLVRCSGGRGFEFDTSPGLTEEQKASGMAAWGKFDWIRPGTFQIQAKWQAGHWDHAKIHSARFAAFGVDSGWSVLPLQKWVTVLTIKVTENDKITVNNIRGRLDGNEKYLE